MRHGSTQRRQRKRGGRGRGGDNRSQVFDSNGPDVRIRGTAYQVAEKYLALAKDAASSDNRVMAESYLQHAEHYQRIINSYSDNVQAKKKEDSSSRSQKSKSKSNSKEDDLSLPNSILGEKAKASGEQEMTTA